MNDREKDLNLPGSVEGGYHSRGVPGEEGTARRLMRVLKVGDRSERIVKTRPLKGAAGARGASSSRLDAHRPDLAPIWSAEAQAPGATFMVAKRGSEFLDTPVFHAGESGDEEAIALFTTREAVERYIDQAGWGGTDEVGELSPHDLLSQFLNARGEGIRWAVVNPARDGHIGGEPQVVLDIEGELSESAGLLARNVRAACEGPRESRVAAQ